MQEQLPGNPGFTDILDARLRGHDDVNTPLLILR
jgi:hypothetical protein